jgi:hypothetical protein
MNVLGTVAYIGAFAMGAGPVPALLLGEMVQDPAARGKVLAHKRMHSFNPEFTNNTHKHATSKTPFKPTNPTAL